MRILEAAAMIDKTVRSADFLALRDRASDLPPAEIDPQRPIWIFGAGNFGRSLALAMKDQGLAVAGFVETSPRVDSVLGLPVLNWQALALEAPNAQLALGIFNRDTPYDALMSLVAAAGFAPPLMPWDLYGVFREALGWRFWLSDRSLLLASMERIARVGDVLADDQSRYVLYRICAFRLGLDMAFSSCVSNEPQYFNELTLPALQGRDITFVDCGAYDGDSYRELVNCPGITCKQAFLLEPDPQNYSRLVQQVTLQGGPAICLPMAAAETYSILTFNAGQGEACSISQAGGDTSIAAVALEQLLPCTHVDVVKLDVEGAEAQVLRGAERIIRNSRPVLIVSLYHNPHDLWALPELLFEYCPNYRFYVRQHSSNSFESVLYAVPNP
ncbi:FkbM family methyltransferase [Pseudomonas guariconensis]|uniref:FkbM family methyltransferase n=1 Tax=Pseudomonas guariconensis TaxID=1288410 RepID=UPI0018AC6FF5|nr:FkbM family methyltransferase [Pseudomonas guariconensis]MBF8757336.1 FkbM family methyltransferase [Pseudomonas guariconensis]